MKSTTNSVIMNNEEQEKAYLISFDIEENMNKRGLDIEASLNLIQNDTDTNNADKKIEIMRKSNSNSLIHDLNITQENLYLLLPSKMSWLATMLADDKGISIVEAIKILYTSPFYTRLADESTKLWHLGPVALYEEYLADNK